jgi:HEAT repeats
MAELLLRDGACVNWDEVYRNEDVCGKVERTRCVALFREFLRGETSAPTLRAGRDHAGCGEPNYILKCMPALEPCMPAAGMLIWALGKIEPPATEAAPEVLAALRRNNPWQSPLAIKTLAHFKSVDAVPYLVALLDNSDVSCRWVAFGGLRELSVLGRPAVPKLIQLLDEGDWHDRSEVALTLATIGDVAAIEPLRRALHHPPMSAQSSAADALASFGDRAMTAVPDLTVLAQTHWFPSVREKAAAAATTISGKAVQPKTVPCVLDIEGTKEMSADGGVQTRFSIPVVKAREPSKPSGACIGVAAEVGTSILEAVGDTCILGFNHGEFGGTLVAIRGQQRKTLRETWYLNPYQLVHVGEDLLVLEGTVHVVTNVGGLTRLKRSPAGEWSAEPLLELPGVPLAARVEPDERLLVLTGENAMTPTCPKARDISALLRIGPGDRVENISGP